jgi:hypothetical protein
MPIKWTSSHINRLAAALRSTMMRHIVLYLTNYSNLLHNWMLSNRLFSVEAHFPIPMLNYLHKHSISRTLVMPNFILFL